MTQNLVLFKTYQQLINTVVDFFSQNKSIGMDEAQLIIKEKLITAKENCLDYDAKDVSLAEFAACAFIDGYALSQKYLDQAKWRKNLLQDEYFNTTDAGILFFTYCEQLNQDQVDLLHLYFFCIASGFNGRYFAMDERPSLQKIMAALLLKIDQTDQQRSLENQGLLLGEKPSEVVFKASLSKKLWFILPIIILIGAYEFFHFSISHIVQSYLMVAS